MKHFDCIFLLVGLSACGKGPSYQPTHVDDELMDNFEAVATSVNEARGYTVIVINPRGYGTVVIDEKLTSAGLIAGYTKIPNVSIRGDMSEILTSYTLAHEIGHALGLQHTACGLMAPVMDSSPDNLCLADPGLCLSDALDAAGL